ncbi:hypothetical protein [Nocardioides alcanivorans]|uniref:hypothetical protein n=1 Tax=Nocardioides alcanivorans TaxID=2897352 RepID=UPI001F451CCB|nr:hypothetical protein [Nocardioides alcanivorans]
MLRLKDFSLVHMDPDTFMWVDLKAFDIIQGRPDEELLAALMATPAYKHNYCSPFDPANMDDLGPALHANWWLDRLSSSMFERVAADDAVETVRAWSEDQDWVNGYEGPSDETCSNLRDNVLLCSPTVTRSSSSRPTVRSMSTAALSVALVTTSSSSSTVGLPCST